MEPDAAAPGDSTTPSPAAARRLRRYLTALVVLAVVVPAVVILVVPEFTPAGGWPLAVVLGVALVATELLRVEIRVGPTTQSTTLTELAILPMVLLLAPATAIAVAFAAGLATEVLLRQRQAQKILFNLSWHVTAVALASLTFATVGGGSTFDASARSIVAALAAAAVFVGWNFTTLSGIVAILSGRRLRRVLAAEWRTAIPLNVVTAVVGILVALLILIAPAALPLLALLGVLIHERQREEGEARERVATERDRFQRTLAGSSDGVVLLDASGAVEVWNPAMAALTGIDEARAVGRDLDELGWSHLLDGGSTGDGELRLEVPGRVLAVRRSDVPASTRSGAPSTVVTVRDVSREAELARIRDDLVMRISHELRTPLTSLEGFLEVLTRHWHELGDDGRQELLQASHRGSRRLSRLVANLMVWAGIESRHVGPGSDRGPVDPTAVLRDVVAEIQLEDIRLEVDDATMVAVSRDDVQVILTNLLSNAALYGAPPVRVAVRRCDDEVEVVVSDEGPGLPPSFRPHLFEPFSQASDGLQRTAKGLGLGLAIVRSVAADHGGGIRHADAPGGGATFTVTLPAADVQPGPVDGLGAASGENSSSR